MAPKRRALRPSLNHPNQPARLDREPSISPTARHKPCGENGRSNRLYHCTIKKFSRGEGQSATAAAAYRAGAEVEDERTGEIHDYTRRSGVVSSHIILPNEHPEWATDRSKLWSAVEIAEKRKNSRVAREAELALPAELDGAQREKLATDFATHLVDKYGVAAEVSVHLPSSDGDQRNHHAHVLFTTRRMDKTGFTEKTRELDDKVTGGQEIEAIRKDFEIFQNRALERAGLEKRVDCRSLEAQREEALERAEEFEERAAAAGGRAEKTWRSSKRKQLSDEAEELRVQAATFRESAANLTREPGQHLGPARTAMKRRMQRQFEQLHEKLAETVERLQQALKDKVQSVRERFERLSERLFQQEQRIALERQSEQRREVIDLSVERVRNGNWDETKLWEQFEVKDRRDLEIMSDDQFADFKESHDEITRERKAQNEILRREGERIAHAEVARSMRDAASWLVKLRLEKGQDTGKSQKEERSVADRLKEIRDSERDADSERKLQDRGRDDDPDFGL